MSEPVATQRTVRRVPLADFKRTHGIKTHDAGPEFDPPDCRWVAVKVPEKRLDDGGPIEGMTVGDMMANFCRLLDEAGLTAYGRTEAEAVGALCDQVHIPFAP